MTQSHSHQYCSFYLGDDLFGIPVECVKEVLKVSSITRVPLAHEMVHGLINLRGDIVTTVDLRKRLKLQSVDARSNCMTIVIRSQDENISLIVDEVGDVLEVHEEAFELPPDTVQGVAREFIRGVYKLKERLLLALDTEKVLNVSLKEESYA